MPEHWIILAVIGLCGGLLSSLLGIGSGALMVPALAALALPQKEAQGIALAVMVPMTLVGALRYRSHPEIEMPWNIIVLLSVTGVIGAFFGATLASGINNLVLRRCFGVFLLLMACKMLFTK